MASEGKEPEYQPRKYEARNQSLNQYDICLRNSLKTAP